MSNFKASCSKTLVRNTKQRVPVTCVVKEPQIKTSEERKAKPPAKHVNETRSRLDLGAPSINASRTAIKNIKALENLKKCKVRNLSEVDNESKTTIQEKITKQMNFHSDQQIYKNLIPLCTKPTPQPILTSRYPQSQKDKEPDLYDFATHKVLPEYCYSVPIQVRSPKSVTEYDGFKMYKLMQKW